LHTCSANQSLETDATVTVGGWVVAVAAGAPSPGEHPPVRGVIAVIKMVNASSLRR